MKFHHLGIACVDLDEAEQFVVRTLGIVSSGEVVRDDNQNANLKMLQTNAGVAVELVSGPIVAGLTKRGTNLYHTCWEVEDIDKEEKELLAAGAMAVTALKPAPLFGGRKVAFYKTPLGLIELLAAGD